MLALLHVSTVTLSLKVILTDVSDCLSTSLFPFSVTNFLFKNRGTHLILGCLVLYEACTYWSCRQAWSAMPVKILENDMVVVCMCMYWTCQRIKYIILQSICCVYLSCHFNDATVWVCFSFSAPNLPFNSALSNIDLKGITPIRK